KSLVDRTGGRRSRWIWGTVGFGAWGNALMTKQHNISPLVAGSIAAWFGAGAVVAKPLLGWLSDQRAGARRTFSMLCLLIFAILLTVFGQASTTAQFYLVAPLLGAAAFGYTPLLIAEVTEVSDQRAAGVA